MTEDEQIKELRRLYDEAMGELNKASKKHETLQQQLERIIGKIKEQDDESAG